MIDVKTHHFDSSVPHDITGGTRRVFSVFRDTNLIYSRIAIIGIVLSTIFLFWFFSSSSKPVTCFRFAKTALLLAVTSVLIATTIIVIFQANDVVF